LAWLTPHTVHPAFEDGTDTGFRNVGQLQFDAGEIPRRKYTISSLYNILVALGSAQPLTEMSTRLFPVGKYGRCVRLTTLPPSRAIFMKSGNLNFLEPYGHSRVVTGLHYHLTCLQYIGTLGGCGLQGCCSSVYDGVFWRRDPAFLS